MADGLSAEGSSVRLQGPWRRVDPRPWLPGWTQSGETSRWMRAWSGCSHPHLTSAISLWTSSVLIAPKAWELSRKGLSVLQSGMDVDGVEPGSSWLHSVVRACYWNCAKNLQISALVQVVTPLSPEEPSIGPGMWPPSNAAHWTGYPARQPE